MSTPTRSSVPRLDLPRALGHRRTSLAGALIAAVLAAVLFAVALRGRPAPAPAPVATATPVLVATRTIHRGTLLSAGVLSAGVRVRSVRASAAVAGAAPSLAAVRGRVTDADIAAGQQLTLADLGQDTGALATRLGRHDRGLTIPVDTEHGMIGDVRAEDRVDVYGSYVVQAEGQTRPHPVLRLLAQDVPVLRAPTSSGSGAAASATGTGHITLQLGAASAQRVAFTADNGKVWIAARPAQGAAAAAPRLVTLDTILKGVQPETIAGGTR